jgi:hypothetical protein
MSRSGPSADQVSGGVNRNCSPLNGRLNPNPQVPLAVVGKRLGHSKISTTLNLYTHIFQDADDQAAAALNLSLGGGK